MANRIEFEAFLLDIPAYREKLVAQLADRLEEQDTDLLRGQALGAASLMVTLFEGDLRHTEDYRLLRDAMCRTMADPDVWDGDGSEVGMLIDYVQHLATATHGDCERCDRPVMASEKFEAVDNVGNSVPMDSPDRRIIICEECA
jgi:hypothetical protein